MKFITKETEILKNCIAAIAEVLDESVFVRPYKDKIIISGSSLSKTIMVHVEIPRTFFESYETNNFEFNVDINELNKFLSKGNKKEKTKLEVINNKLSLKFLGKTNREFLLPLMMLKGDEIKNLPNPIISSKFYLDSDIFVQMIKDALTVSDEVIINVKENLLYFKSKGLTSEYCLEIKNGKGFDKIEYIKETKSKFQLDFLSKIIKGAKISEIVAINCGNDVPVNIRFTAIDKLTIQYFVAPMAICM